MTGISISFEPNWLNGWWYRLCAAPYVAVEGAVTRCRWGTDTEVRLAPGQHRVRTFVRYRRVLRGDLAESAIVVRVVPGRTIRVVASNGVTNASPFVPRALD